MLPRTGSWLDSYFASLHTASGSATPSSIRLPFAPTLPELGALQYGFGAGLLRLADAARNGTALTTNAAVAMPAAETGRSAVSPSDPHAIQLYSVPNDTLFPKQWHLINTGQSGGVAGVDLNVQTVWDEYTGAGVHVGIWDDGVQYDHPDLDGNYDATRHILDNNGNIHDPYPQSVDSAHGTAVAGVIAAQRDGSGTVGVAYGASITGIDMFFDPDLSVENSTTHLEEFDVTNHSWGYTSGFNADILSADPYWVSFFGGLMDSVDNGRGGLGTINLVAAGNDREIGRHANDSNFTSMPQTIAVAAVSHDGFVSYYSTPGSNVLIASPSNGATGAGIWTTDRTGADGYSDGTNQGSNTDPDHTSSFGGTSSATPATTGVVALMLEANPNLGWRDVQTILAMTARHTGSAIGDAHSGTELYDWGFNGAGNWNAGGMHFSNDYGFGLTDALAAVRLAESWTEQNTSANWSTGIVDTVTFTGGTVIRDNDIAGVDFTFTVTDDTVLEHVGLVLDITNADWYGYLITLTSPDGTVSVLSHDHNDSGSLTPPSWWFTSNAFRGETGVGTWTVHIADLWDAFEGTLTSAKLEFYGAEPSADDTYVFTNEYGDYAGDSFHGFGIQDGDGGNDTLNLSAVTSGSTVILDDGGMIDGVPIGSFSSEPPEITGIENVFGGDGDDAFTGNGVANLLKGYRGADTLRGGAGTDTLVGGTGNDTYYDVAADDPATSDTFVEVAGGGGHDLVISDSGSFSLLGRDEIEDLTGTAATNNLTGNAKNNILTGAAGSDTLDGAGGNDTMDGGEGDDLYTVNSKNDVVTETTSGAAGGADTVSSTASTFTLGDNVEDLTLTGTGNSEGIGNTLDNRITGNTGGNALKGLDGADTLTGGEGDDELRGGTGADRMNGGNGNDRFFVDISGDQTIETSANIATGGIDTVFTTVSRTLNSNIENLRLQGSDPINGTGNELNNKIFGNAGANLLKGLVGNDTIEGKDGADTIEGGEGNDTLSGGGQGDVFRFAASNTGVDRILDFSKNGDRFDLSGGTFTAISTAANGDTVLTHAGGAIRIASPPNLTLAQWNALVLPSGAKAAEVTVASDVSGHEQPFDAGHFALSDHHGDWLLV